MPDTSTLRLTVPQMAESFARHEFDPNSRRWPLNKDVTLNLDKVFSRLAPRFHDPYRLTMKHYAEEHAAKYCQGIHLGVQKFLTDMDVDRFSVTALRNYRASLDRDNEYRLGTIRAFLERWHGLGFPGVCDDTAKWLSSVRLKGNVKGRSVRSMDPRDGPFDDQELSAILNVAPQEYGRQRIDLPTLACTLLLAHTGRRPVQISLLRIGDIRRTMTQDGRSIDVLSIPRVKQRGQPPRTEFKHFWLPPDVSDLVTKLSRMVVEKAEAHLGKLPGTLVKELPLFPNWTEFAEIHSEQELWDALSNDELHMRTQDLTAGLSKIRVVSARTGDTLHITPRRFRYTLGTRAAREGNGAMIIAELLDHSDIQSVKVYTRDHPNARQWIDKAVGEQLAPVARMFAGTVVDTEQDARHGDNPAMRVGTRDQKVGTCGSQGWCGAQALACYTCMHFQPWVDAPHREVLTSLVERRQQTIDAGASETVASALDPSIHAVRAVIVACEARKAELAGAPNARSDPLSIEGTI